MKTAAKELRYFVDERGVAPAEDWIEGLRDRKAAHLIRTRLDRLAHGNAGDHRHVGDGVRELRIHFGPGYRVYYAEDGRAVVLLLCGGDKRSQSRDIARARKFWAIQRSGR